MPFIEVILGEGRLSREVKRTLCEGISGVMNRVLHSKSEQVRIVLYEIPEENLFDGSAPVSKDLTDKS